MLKIKTIGSNQTELHLGSDVIFFSYETPVAAFVSGKGYIQSDEKYSRTTSKHINNWLRRSTGHGYYPALPVPQYQIDALVNVVKVI